MIENPKRVHFVGVGGVGMGTFAVALARAGYEVTGSDNALYEPMKGVLSSNKIALTEGFKAENAEKFQPDLVVIGNVVRRDNPEAQAWIRSGRPFLSFPEAVRRFLIEERHAVVVAGTHGKTTTATWISYLLKSLDLNPSYLIGGVPRDLETGCVLAGGKYFVGEGDEYDSAFFDKGPKFLHYAPHTLVLNNIEFDHADIYRDFAHYKASFEKLVALLPGDGLCLARFDDPAVTEITPLAICPVQTFGMGIGAMWRLGKVEQDRSGFVFEVIYKGRSAGQFKTPLLGEHNLMNLIAGIAVAVNLGTSMDRIRPVVESFRGVRRRQEILVDDSVVLIDDFAHHPTEVAATLKAVRTRYPQGRLNAFFEPRSATARRSTHQEEYAKAFEPADRVFLAAPYKAADLAQGERFSADTLTQALKARGKDAASFPNVPDMLAGYAAQKAPGDILVVMSNGEFDKIQEKLRKLLTA